MNRVGIEPVDVADDVFGVRATVMRGGASKGVFFAADDLPGGLLQRPSVRDRLLSRLVGSPDPQARHVDGLGGATPATSKVVIVSRSLRDDCDVDFLFGAVSIDDATIDWTGNCDELTTAVGPFAIARGWVAPADRDATRTTTTVRLWQQSLGKRIVAHVPTRAARVVETGAFFEDGVPFGGAEIRLEFLDPAERELLPTGNACDDLRVPELADRAPDATLRATLIDVDAPMVIVRADALKLSGREMPDAVARDAKLLACLDAIRARAAVAMGLTRTIDEAARDRSGMPALALVAGPAAYRSAGGIDVDRGSIDVLARIVSSSGLTRAGADSIALAAAAALPGTVVSEVARTLPGVPTRIGHAWGVLAVGAVVERRDDRWHVERATMSRSARRLMDGIVYAPRPA